MARQARGMSQGELSSLSGVSQGSVSKLENGLIEPNEDMVKRLAGTLRFPLSLFFEPDRVYGLPLSVHPGAKYRKQASVGQRELDRLEAELNLRLMHIRRLLKSAEFEGELPLPKMDVDQYDGPEAIAELIRRAWLVPSGPIANLVNLVERAGCIVVLCDFEDMLVDGVTLQAPRTPPCIFLNHAQPGDRQRFTVAHELGHIVMHQLPSPEMEDEANAFASSLLMPPREMRSLLAGRLTLQRLAALKPIWKVSMQALLMCARSVGAITDNQSRYLWRQLSSMGIRRHEPAELEIPPETPSVLPEILRMHLEDLGYSIADLGQFLHVGEDDLRRMHPLPGRSGSEFLRIIK
jgi:Zn-dependent peptidase ImmA (M78 family)/transcriptional regulator with XRE-family HTH domain